MTEPVLVPETTPTGVPIIECGECGHTHPATRRHCPTCGLATLFGHQKCRAADAFRPLADASARLAEVLTSARRAREEDP